MAACVGAIAGKIARLIAVRKAFGLSVVHFDAVRRPADGHTRVSSSKPHPASVYLINCYTGAVWLFNFISLELRVSALQLRVWSHNRAEVLQFFLNRSRPKAIHTSGVCLQTVKWLERVVVLLALLRVRSRRTRSCLAFEVEI